MECTIASDGAVPEVSFLYCTLGTQIGFLQATNMDVTISDEIMGTHRDIEPVTNVSGFLGCVAAPDRKCSYSPGEWSPVDTHVTCGDLKTLRTDSKMTCASLDGQIRIFLNIGELILHAGRDTNLENDLVGFDRELLEALNLFQPNVAAEMAKGAFGTTNQEDFFDNVADFTESAYGAGFSSFGVASSLHAARAEALRLRAIQLRREYRTVLAMWGEIARSGGIPSVNASRTVMMHRARYWQAVNEALAAKRVVSAGNSVRIVRILTPAGKVVTRTIGPLGIALDTIEGVDRLRDGNYEGAALSGVKVVSGAAMMSGNPYVMAGGAVVYTGVLIYENREAIGDALQAIADTPQTIATEVLETAHSGKWPWERWVVNPFGG